MAYTDHFDLADKLITHLDGLGAGAADPLDQARYASFVAVSATTVYELAVKEIFVSFSTKKHGVFGAFTVAHFFRLNGRIKTSDLKEHVKMFGDRYLKRYQRIEEETEERIVTATGVSVRSAYNNLITWRNEFAHQGKLLTTATYSEVKDAYQAGKEILNCLANAMTR